MKKQLKKLESNRLLYRAFNVTDASRVHMLLQEKEISDNTLNIPYPYEQGMAEDWISTHQEQLDSDDFIYAVVLKKNHHLIGSIGLTVFNEHQHGCIGYWLGKPYWGMGYGTEMASRIIQFGFEDLALHRIYGEHYDFNIASARVMEKNNMVQEGRLREHKLKNGAFLNSNVKGILKSEWR